MGIIKNCGGGEIRTHGALRHSCFQDKCDRPLCHASLFKAGLVCLQIFDDIFAGLFGNSEDINDI